MFFITKSKKKRERVTPQLLIVANAFLYQERALEDSLSRENETRISRRARTITGWSGEKRGTVVV